MPTNMETIFGKYTILLFVTYYCLVKIQVLLMKFSYLFRFENKKGCRLNYDNLLNIIRDINLNLCF